MGDYDIGGDLVKLIELIKFAKPNDRSDLDRRYAILLTELEKVYAYFMTYVL
jgi:hypothetical protein